MQLRPELPCTEVWGRAGPDPKLDPDIEVRHVAHQDQYFDTHDYYLRVGPD